MRGDIQNGGKCALKCRPEVNRNDKEKEGRNQGKDKSEDGGD
jgi:hypothetical protein